MEIWKNIKGYEGLYQVSDQGRVKSLERIIIKKDGRKFTVKERVLKPGETKDGYLIVALHAGEKQKNTYSPSIGMPSISQKPRK